MTAADWGISELDLGMQAVALPEPVLKWGTVSRSAEVPGNGTVFFYTDDYKFSRLWTEHDVGRPSSLVGSGCRVAVELNFSTYDTMPRAEALWGICRKRTLARAWQQAGVRVLVDLNVDTPFHDLALLGVPRGWTAYATKKHRDIEIAALEAQYEMAVAHAAPNDPWFVVFGGAMKVQKLCAARGWTWGRSSRDWRQTPAPAEARGVADGRWW